MITSHELTSRTARTTRTTQVARTTQATRTIQTTRTSRVHRAGRKVRLAAFILAFPVLGLTLAACSSSASATAKPTSTADSAQAQAVKYAECMRSHGEPNFPDPNAQGDFQFSNNSSSGSTAMDPNSSTYQAAASACQSLQPGGQVSAAQENAQFQKVLKAAACIRANGYPDYPEPQEKNGAIGINLNNTDIDTSSPAFQKVAQKCGAPQGMLPPTTGAAQ